MRSNSLLHHLYQVTLGIRNIKITNIKSSLICGCFISVLRFPFNYVLFDF